MNPGDDAYFSKILDLVHRIKGFDGQNYKVNYVKRRVAVRMRATKSGTYRDYFQFLSQNQEEATHLLDRLTIHVTEFFRDPEIYEALREKAIPELMKSALDKRIRVWSAACSTGEEPYSLAFLLGEVLAQDPDFTFEILATDVDAASLKTARWGEYPGESVKKLSKKTLGKMFRVEGTRFKVLPSLQKRVRFAQLDLLGAWPGDFAAFDLILCRNLLIYLTAPQQQKLYEGFSRVLNPGGFLVLGLTETLLGPARDLYRCVDIRSRFYRLAAHSAQARG
ncbi:MAG TPA: protein-glutamate O-methyltransferase CheR [bacterium]|nr:protein-glutamate O-methyltransferase CheR [bacterium]